MHHVIGEILLRKPEPEDLPELYQYKNDPMLSYMLGGFSSGYAMRDMQDWLEHHRQSNSEVIWSIVYIRENKCLGHVGLYQIDHRIRTAQVAIMIGDPNAWGKGYGKACMRFAIQYGFAELNLNRIYLNVLSTNKRAFNVYKSIGFVHEGCLRQAQYKKGIYIDVIVMSILRDEYECTDE